MMHFEVKKAIDDLDRRITKVDVSLKSWTRVFTLLPTLVVLLLGVLAYFGFKSISDVAEPLQERSEKLDKRLAELDSQISEQEKYLWAALDEIQGIQRLKSEVLAGQFKGLEYNRRVTGQPTDYAKCDSVALMYNWVFSLFEMTSGRQYTTGDTITVQILVEDSSSVTQQAFFQISIEQLLSGDLRFMSTANREIFLARPGLNKLWVSSNKLRSGDYNLKVSLFTPDHLGAHFCEEYASIVILELKDIIE